MLIANAQGVLEPHITLVVNCVAGAISTITDCTVSGVLFNLVQ